MQTKSLESVNQRLAGYESEVEHWKCDHDLAMECMDFELLLQHGLSVYAAINWIDESWRGRLFSKQESHDPHVEQMLRALYELEMGTRYAFHSLMADAGKPHGWTLIAEQEKKVGGKG